jgi:hypothetical protein
VEWCYGQQHFTLPPTGDENAGMYVGIIGEMMIGVENIITAVGTFRPLPMVSPPYRGVGV